MSHQAKLYCMLLNLSAVMKLIYVIYRNFGFSALEVRHVHKSYGFSETKKGLESF